MPSTRYKVWAWAGPVGAGAMQSVHIAVAGVAKKATAGMPHSVAAELICGNLARSLLLPTPPSFIVEDSVGTPHHVSLNFALSGQNLPPADPSALVAAHHGLACGIVVFDAWIVNPDRHNANLAFDQSTGKVMIFDHSHAFIGASSNVDDWLSTNAGQLGVGGHCLCPHLKDAVPMKAWLDRINAIPEFYVRDVIAESVSVGLPAGTATACSDFLLARRDQLLTLLKRNPGMFPNMPADALSQL